MKDFNTAYIAVQMADTIIKDDEEQNADIYVLETPPQTGEKDEMNTVVADFPKFSGDDTLK